MQHIMQVIKDRKERRSFFTEPIWLRRDKSFSKAMQNFTRTNPSQGNLIRRDNGLTGWRLIRGYEAKDHS